MTDITKLNSETFAHLAVYYSQLYVGRNADIEYWIEAAKRYGGPITEVGCGTGRILVPLSSTGVEVVGIDNSPQMLSELRKTLNDREGQGNTVSIIEADLHDAWRRLKISRQIFFTFGVFQYVVDDHSSVLSGYAGCLAPDGRIVLDLKAFLEDPKYLACLDRQVTGKTIQYETHDKVIHATPTISWDSYSQIITERYDHVVKYQDGRESQTFTTVHRMRSYSMPEIHSMAALAGLRVHHVDRSYGGSGAGPRYLVELKM